MSNENIAFRSSFRGYNKKDVYKYLENLNREAISKTNELQQLKCELQDSNEKLKQKIISAESETAKVKEELNKEKIEHEKNSAEKDSEIDRLIALCSSKDDLISQKQTEIDTLYEQLNAKETILKATKEELTQKDSLIDELDSAAVKISLELDALSDDYKGLLARYEELAGTLQCVDELQRKARAYDKISERVKSYSLKAKEESFAANVKTATDTVKKDINDILSVSADEIMDHLKTTQARLNSAIENAQKETDLLKQRIGRVISSSKDKIVSQIQK